MRKDIEKGFDFEKLVIMSFDGSISEDDFRRLDDLLGRDGDARKKYFDLLKLNQSLCSYENILGFVPDSIRAECNGQKALGDTGLDPLDHPDIGTNGSSGNSGNVKIGQSYFLKSLLRIAAVLAISMSAIWFVHSLKTARPEPFQKLESVATLDVVRGVSWDSNDDVLQAGDRLFVNQEIKLLTGSARIRFDNNADVLVQGPVSLRLKGEKLLYLERGKLTASIPPSAKGFTVLTPVAEVVDYGTEFGVTVDESGETETSVFKGEVDLRAADSERLYKPQRITAGWSNTVDEQMKLSDDKTVVDETLYKRLSFNVNINFQPKEAEVPKGYMLDDGSAFADRGNGYFYGWSRDISGSLSNEVKDSASRHRENRIEYDDRRYDTLVHMQKLGRRTGIAEDSTWEIGVPNGTYQVDLVMGDPMYTDQTNNILVESIAISDADGEDNFDRYSDVTVEVTDGRLSIKPGPDSHNAKLCFIKIFQK